MGNPFSESSDVDLLVLDTRGDHAGKAVIDTMNQTEKLWRDQYNTYAEERLISKTKPITDPIKRQSFVVQHSILQ